MLKLREVNIETGMGKEVKREGVYEELVSLGLGWDEMERRRTLQAHKEQSHRVKTAGHRACDRGMAGSLGKPEGRWMRFGEENK